MADYPLDDWYYAPDPTLAEQERLAAENAAALEDPNYVDPWAVLLERWNDA